MSEVDLIPNSYRRLQSHIRLLKILAGAVVVTVTIAGLVIISFNHGIKRLHLEVAELQQQKNVSMQQRDQLVRIQEAKTKYGNQLDLLNKLRGGATVGHMFKVIDRALADENLWFLHWRLMRGDVQDIQEGNVKPASNTAGNFLLGGKQKGIEMIIKGQAQDYESLSRFVNNLLGQPEIKNVRVVNTSLRRYTSSTVVDFNLSVHVRQQDA